MCQAVVSAPWELWEGWEDYSYDPHPLAEISCGRCAINCTHSNLQMLRLLFFLAAGRCLIHRH
jgi:hypothetical protein